MSGGNNSLRATKMTAVTVHVVHKQREETSSCIQPTITISYYCKIISTIVFFIIYIKWYYMILHILLVCHFAISEQGIVLLCIYMHTCVLTLSCIYYLIISSIFSRSNNWTTMLTNPINLTSLQTIFNFSARWLQGGALFQQLFVFIESSQCSKCSLQKRRRHLPTIIRATRSKVTCSIAHIKAKVTILSPFRSP